MKKYIYLFGLIILGALTSCDQDIENSGVTDTAEPFLMTGQWIVTAYNDTSAVTEPFKLVTTKMTSAGNDSIIIHDSEQKFWEFQIKASANMSEGTFETELSQCEISDENIGVIISNGVISEANKISFEIQFEDDETPYGNTYRIIGERI